MGIPCPLKQARDLHPMFLHSIQKDVDGDLIVLTPELRHRGIKASGEAQS